MVSKITSEGYEISKNILNNEQISKLKHDLRIIPKCSLEFGEQIEPYDSYIETAQSFIIPKFYGIKLFGYPSTNTIKPQIVKFNFTQNLRPHQHVIVGICVADMLKNGGTILSVPCGFGKTVMAIYIARMLGLKTMVLVHKSVLLYQWIDRIKFYSDASVGIIRQNKIDVEGKDIIVGMIQSISMRDYESKIFKNIGLLIVDEAHHIVAKVFSKSLSKVGGIYTLGLTATPHRSDGLTKLLYWYLGPTMYKEDRRTNQKVLVRSFNFQSTHKLFAEKTKWIMGKHQPMCPKMITNFCNIPKRNELLVQILDVLRKNPERKIIVLSGRINHLELLKNEVDKLIHIDEDNGILEKNEYKTYYYIGKMKTNERQMAEKYGDILFATYELAQEGLDIDRLNTVILATPKRNVEQAIGRIMRKILKSTDMKPMIIDIVDQLSVFYGQGKARWRLYKKNKYLIKEYYCNDKYLVRKNERFDVKSDNINKYTVNMSEILDDNQDDQDSQDVNSTDDCCESFNPNVCIV